MDNIQNKNEKEQIAALLKLCLKHWYYFVISMIVCIIIAVLYLKIKTPVMEIAAQVSMRQDDSLTGGPSGSSSLLSAFGMKNSSVNIEDETLKMSSQGYIRNVVKNLDLNKIYIQSNYLGFVKNDVSGQSPVLLTTDPAHADTISRSVRFSLNIQPEQTTVKMKLGRKTIGKYQITSFPSTIQTPWGAYTFEKTPYFDLYDKPVNLKIIYTNYDYMAQVYRNGKLNIDYEKKTSNLIHLGTTNKNVKLAKQILSEIIEVYNLEWVKEKDYLFGTTTSYIDQRIGLVKSDLDVADMNIQNFKKANNLTNIESDISYYTKLASDVQVALLEAETQLKMVDIIRDFVIDEKNKYSLIPFSLTTSDPSISAVISQYNELLIKRSEISRSPQQSTFAQSLDGSIDLQRKNLLQSLDNVYKGVKINRQTLKDKELELNGLMRNVPSAERDFIQLKREQELQQTMYIFLLEKKEETRINFATWMPKLKIIDEPYIINKPVEPNTMKVALTTLFMGAILIPLSLIYGSLYIRRRKKE
ncbi:MAG: hypothetical protein LBO74_07200 [Candidatus Symbiothrix sp.]|jgi:uncharacterized protein involved in exopolysaccharide biosynthesis|nr:hypothetical protein [Candidatus Symbiothrix sp.]